MHSKTKIIFLVLVFVQTCLSLQCPNIKVVSAPPNTDMIKLSCTELIEDIDGGDSLMELSNANRKIFNCLYLKTGEMQTQDDIFSCYCPPGYTDNGNGLNTKGVFFDITHKHLGTITCGDRCAPGYDSIVNIQDERICGCLNFGGCVFEDRGFIDLYNRDMIYKPSLILVPNDVTVNADIIQCRQENCKESVDIQYMNLCMLAGIEYIFCETCPHYCTWDNFDCILHPSTRQCDVKCKEGFFMQTNSQREYMCVVCSECDVNTKMTRVCRPDGNVDTTCEQCPLGKFIPNRHMYHTDCIDCPSKSTTTSPGTQCVMCPRNHIVQDGICTACLSLVDGEYLMPNATSCTDIVHVNPGDGISCSAGYEWSAVFVECVPCEINWNKKTSGDTACEMCPDGKYTMYAGSTVCQFCADGMVRNNSQKECTVCPAGKYALQHTETATCVQCTGSNISTPGALLCDTCNDMYYASADNTACIPCPPGTKRIDNALSCSLCKQGFSLQDGTCVPCNISPFFSCNLQFYEIDNCTEQNASFPCVCGCTNCRWTEYVNKKGNELFTITPPCTLQCVPGYRLMQTTTTLSCVLDSIVQSQITSAEEIHFDFIFDPFNSASIEKKFCIFTLDIDSQVINSRHHMHSCIPNSENKDSCLHISTTILHNHILPIYVNSITENTCFFACHEGRVFEYESLDHNHKICVSSIAGLDGQCSPPSSKMPVYTYNRTSALAR